MIALSMDDFEPEENVKKIIAEILDMICKAPIPIITI